MAMIEKKACCLCQKVTEHNQGNCLACNQRDENQRRLKKEEYWNSLTVEEKLDYLFKLTLSKPTVYPDKF